MARYFGVYLGRTTASVSLFQDGKWEMVANDGGDRVTPSVVSFTDQDELVGDAALHELIRNERNTICGAKEFVGRQIDDDEITRPASNKIVAKDGMFAYEVVHEGKTKVVTPSEITEKIYKNLAETASRHGCDADFHDAVITAPVSFTCEQCDALKEAAENAGFNVLRVINEPAAAVLAYGLNETDVDSSFNILVYHLGGATLEVSVVQVLGGLLHVMATVSDNDINGQALDDLLVEYLASEFQRQRKADCRSNKRSLVKLRFAAENCRKVLSTLPSSNCSVESLFDGFDFQTTLSRSRFDGLCGNFVQSCLAPIDEVLSQAGLSKDGIHKIVLTGGCTKMPLLQQKLQEFLPSATLLASISPDEVVTVGAAIQAGILGGAGVKAASDNLPVAVPCMSAAILCKVGDDGSQVVPIFQKFTPLPTHKRISLQLGPSQTAFALDLLEQSVIGNVLIGRVCMNEIVAGTLVEVKLDMDRDGNLCVNCTAGDKVDTVNISIISHNTASAAAAVNSHQRSP